MYEFLRENQLNIMLVLSGVCAITAVFVLVSKNMSKLRKFSLVLLEFSATFLMIFDRFAYIYRGDTSQLGYWMVRVSNFFVFFLIIITIFAFNLYLSDFFKNKRKLSRFPKRLNAAGFLLVLAAVMVIISQFTGLYYTFDENNLYQRQPGFVVGLLMPIVIIILQLSVIISYRKKINKIMWISMLIFSTMPLIASIAQLFLYGLSLNNLTIVMVGVLLYVFSLVDMNTTLEKVHKQEVEYLTEKRNSMSRLFDQIGSSIMETVDGKNPSTKGHSKRVANYSREIARLSGMSEYECEKVYFSGLLHDIGKMGISDEILNKEDKLSDEEEKIFQNHAIIGNKILSGIKEYSYLGEGALYHHERYDGSGYPNHLKGSEIPQYARIIAIADAYDSMTTKKKYRNPLSQLKVREEFIKESGIKFDPKFTKIMIRMIDDDRDYKLRGDINSEQEIWKKEVVCNNYKEKFSTGLVLTDNVKKIEFKYTSQKAEKNIRNYPTIIIYDSLDGYIHTSEREIMDNNYLEFGEIWLDGHTATTRAKNIETKIINKPADKVLSKSINLLKNTKFEIEAGRYKDHIRLNIKGGGYQIESIIAISDSSRYIYLGITGEDCIISEIKKEDTKIQLKEGDIPRIVDKVSYTNRLESDLKNIQIESRRAVSTPGVLINEEMRIKFNTRSLPNAHLVWHCPYIVIFYSDDGLVDGKNYIEYVLIRLDGEIEESKEFAENKMYVSKNEKFESWDKWNSINQRGMECIVDFQRKGNQITIYTENEGIYIKNTTTITSDKKDVYVALTGDRCAFTDIRVIKL